MKDGKTIKGPDVLFGKPDGPDGWGADDALHPLPVWCSTNDCDDERCHRCFPRKGCYEHRKCIAHREEVTNG